MRRPILKSIRKFRKEKEAKKWYYDAVVSTLILRGLSRKDALARVKSTRLKKQLKLFPDIVLHYDLDTIADEAEAVFEKLHGGNKKRMWIGRTKEK